MKLKVQEKFRFGYIEVESISYFEFEEWRRSNSGLLYPIVDGDDPPLIPFLTLTLRGLLSNTGSIAIPFSLSLFSPPLFLFLRLSSSTYSTSSHTNCSSIPPATMNGNHVFLSPTSPLFPLSLSSASTGLNATESLRIPRVTTFSMRDPYVRIARS